MLHDEEQHFLIAMGNNLRTKFRYLAERTPGMEVHTLGDMQYVNSQRASYTFNTIFGQPSSPDEIHAITHYYHEKNYPAVWWIIPSESTHHAEHLLCQAKWSFDQLAVGMYFPMEKFVAPPISQFLTIKECQSPADYQAFGEVLASIFDDSQPLEAESARVVYQKMSTLPKSMIPDLDLFIGYEGAEPVATAAAFFTQDIGGIFNITTRPDKRKRGYGTALFYTALTRIKERGAIFSILEALPDGLALYEHEGFKPFGTVQGWNNRKILRPQHL